MLHKAFSNYLIHEDIIFRQIAPTNIIRTSLLVIRTGNCKTTLCWVNYGVFNWQKISNQGEDLPIWELEYTSKVYFGCPYSKKKYIYIFVFF